MARLICWLTGHQWVLTADGRRNLAEFRVIAEARLNWWVCRRCGQESTTHTHPSARPPWQFWKR